MEKIGRQRRSHSDWQEIVERQKQSVSIPLTPSFERKRPTEHRLAL